MEKSIHSVQYEVFLDTFRATRRRAGLTQTELARRVGETQSFVSKCERGERRIDIVELRTYCKAIGISMREFIEAFDQALQARGSRRPSKR